MKKPKAKTKVHRAVTHVKAKVKHPKAKTAHEKVSHKPVARKRAWTPDGDVACCSARAVAEAVRLATGQVLSDADVLALYWSTASDPDEGQTLTDALGAVWMLGAPGPAVRTVSHVPADRTEGALILGLDLPWGEPHAVTYNPADGTWWSWGQPMSPADFPGAVIEEAWQVTWV